MQMEPCTSDHIRPETDRYESIEHRRFSRPLQHAARIHVQHGHGAYQ